VPKQVLFEMSVFNHMETINSNPESYQTNDWQIKDVAVGKNYAYLNNSNFSFIIEFYHNTNGMLKMLQKKYR